jgi:uncharacterized protein (DUF1778 family)
MRDKAGRKEKKHWLQIRLALDEKELFQRAADAKGLSLSSWTRMILLEAAKEHARREDEERAARRRQQ